MTALEERAGSFPQKPGYPFYNAWASDYNGVVTSNFHYVVNKKDSAFKLTAIY